MTFKKAATIFLIVYTLIGLYVFIPMFLEDKPIEDELPPATEKTIALEWNVLNELEGNFRTPIWLRNAEFKGKVQEIEYTPRLLGEPVFTSSYQLISLFAQLQLGDPTVGSSFVHPYFSHTDYDSKRVADIDNRAKDLAGRITKNQTIVNVKISSPTESIDNEVFHDVILRFSNGEEIVVPDLPMVLVKEDHEHAEDRQVHHDQGMWYLNINLQELAQRVEKRE